MPTHNKNLKQIDARTILHPSTNANEFAKTGSKIMAKGKGIYLHDTDNNKLIDAVAGLWCVNVGYGRSELADAMHSAATNLSYYHTFTGMSNVPQIELAERLLDSLSRHINSYSEFDGITIISQRL